MERGRQAPVLAMKFPGKPDAANGRSDYVPPVLILQGRSPMAFKRWLVSWMDDGEKYALAGPFDFVAEIASALERLAIMDGAPVNITWHFLEPSTRNTPTSLYVLAKETVRRWTLDVSDFVGWESAFKVAGLALPDPVYLSAYRTYGTFQMKRDQDAGLSV